MDELIDEALLVRLKRCKDLPTPPAVAARIIELSGKETSDIATLANIVTLDPALSAKILSIANSSLYMRRVEADSIEQAVAMFGWTGTLNLALSFAVMGSIRGTLSSGIDYDYFWRRSLAAATAARALGQVAGYKQEELLFLPALLQDIGMLALDRAIPELYSAINSQQHDHYYLQQLEKEKINTDHAIIGEWLLADWALPEEITQLVGVSHATAYMSAENENIVAQKCIFMSGYIADCLVVDEKYQDMQKVARLIEEHMSLSATDFLSLVGHVAGQFHEMANIFDVDIGDVNRLQSIKELAKLTLLPDE